MKNQLERGLAIAFGLIFVSLSVIVTVETVIRKVFNTSLQGADELGGYALALGATIAFTLALISRSHVRVDILLARFPRRLQTVLHWLSAVLMAGFAVLMASLAWSTLLDSRDYGSVSPTPWATPLIYPQFLWVLALVIFAAMATLQAVLASKWLVQGKHAQINALLAPKSTQEEVQEEVADLQARSEALSLKPQAGLPARHPPASGIA